MKKHLIMAMACMMTLAGHATVTADYQQVVPLPQTIKAIKGGNFVLNRNTVISYTAGSNDMKRNAKFLSDYISDMTKLKIGVVPSSSSKTKAAIRLVLNRKATRNIPTEGYLLKVDKGGVEILASSASGIFYGIQTLRKSLPILSTSDDVALPAAIITDAPRFGYRGMHLDCARHFFPVKFVKEYIDMLALHNMNRFHWHLTDDQGWRFEVAKYPKLIEVGSMRSGTVIGHNSEVEDGIPHGSYYTDTEIRDIVKYAADRYITIIPEVDMPGHMMAALAAYPELGCTGGPYQTGRYWGVYDDILCAGNEKVYQFVKDVLDKVCELFPSEYIHIGGDESPRTKWEKCPKCQAKIESEGIKASGKKTKEALLQGYFDRRIQKYLEFKGRKIIGWDELLGCDVDTTATIMSWQGSEPGAIGASLGHDVIMAPQSHLYFDHYQNNDHQNEPMALGGFSDVEKVYSLEPVAPSLTSSAKKHIIGVQANLWTEYISTINHAEYMILPRMAALSEVQWQKPSNKDFSIFKDRLTKFRHIYELYGWHYAHHLWPEEFRKEAKKY